MFQRTSVNAYKVAVLGAAGGIGQPLSMLMKSNPIVSKLALYDIANAVGVAADCSHISSPAECKGFNKGDLEECLKGSDVVIIPAGVPRKPGMTRDDLFNTNASIVRDLSTACGKYCKDAAICVISNPVNSTVPIAAEALKAEGAYNPRKLFGVTTLDIMRSKTFVGQAKGMNPFDLSISVVGGHSGPTIVPLLGQTGFNFTQEEIAALTQRIQYGGDEVVKAKDGAGSATLSMAQAAAEFANSLLKATRGDKGITECTYVESPVVEGLEFFATRVELGAKGVEKIHDIGATTAFEKDLLVACKEQLAKDIAKGKAFMKQ